MRVSSLSILLETIRIYSIYTRITIFCKKCIQPQQRLKRQILKLNNDNGHIRVDFPSEVTGPPAILKQKISTFRNTALKPSFYRYREILFFSTCFRIFSIAHIIKPQ